MNKKDDTFKSVTEIIEHGMKRMEQNEITPTEGVMEQSEASSGEGVVEQNGEMEKNLASGTEAEVEEGEVTDTWSNVSPGKASRSPSKALKYGQVKIASRFSALEDLDDNGDLDKVMKENELPLIPEKAQDGVEIIGTRAEIPEDSGTEQARQDIETKGDPISPGRIATKSNFETGEKSEKVEQHERTEFANVSEDEMPREENQCQAGSVFGGNSNLRPSLPRNSKTNHKIVPTKDTENPGPQGRRSNRKSSQ